MTHFAEVQCFACQASSFLAASNEAMLQNCACYFLRVGDLYSLAERVNVKSIAGVLCLSPLHQHEHTPQVDDEDLDMARWECRRLEKALGAGRVPRTGRMAESWLSRDKSFTGDQCTARAQCKGCISFMACLNLTYRPSLQQ